MAKRKKKIEPWTPFEHADVTETNKALAAAGLDPEDNILINSRYQVNVRTSPFPPPGWPCDIIHLSVKRRDKLPIHDWRDLQRIKNELVGPDNEAVEIYPAESRLVDTANQYHLWVFADPAIRLPFGFNQRLVSGEDGLSGSKQRPFEKGNEPEGQTDKATLQDMAKSASGV